METLDAIAHRHGTDKRSGPGGHNFAPIYEQLFAPLRDKPITLFEIGIETGASLCAWEEFFPRARIYGMDISPDKIDRKFSNRTAWITGDQGHAEQMEYLAEEFGPFDIVIDDGGHLADQQLTSLLALWPALKPGGIYAVEDIHTSYLPDWQGKWRGDNTFVARLKEILDDVNVSWHGQPVTLPDLASMHVYPELAVLMKR